MYVQKLKDARKWIEAELEKCINFWIDNGIDEKHGGVYTCLDREGNVFSTDKSVWMRGRCGWIFAWLCNVYGKNEKWMKISKSCLDFMEQYCFNKDAGNRMYFTVTEDGQPLRQRRYFYSESFYAIANAEYYGLTGDKVYLERALWAYNVYLDLWHGKKDPVGMPPKTNPITRKMRSFGLAMICLNITNVLMRVDGDNNMDYQRIADECVDDILSNHYHPELGCVLENVSADGKPMLDITDGRIVNPGHDIEGVWFMVEYAKRTGNKELLEKAEDIYDMAVKIGWDSEFGGLLYFVDALGYPPESYEHDMKLWWPHNEMIISSLMLYGETKKEKYLDWFFKTLDYCKQHFADYEYEEWYGYLRRDGKPTLPACKGSTFKGPFHLPRMLSMADMIIKDILNEVEK